MWPFSSKRNRRGNEKLDIMSLILDVEDIDILKVKRNLNSLEKIDIYSNEVTLNDIENFFLHIPELQSNQESFKTIFKEIFRKTPNYNYQQVPQQIALYELGAFSNQIDFEIIRYLYSKYELELRNYVISKLKYRYLKSLRKLKKITSQITAVSDLPLLSCLLEYNDLIENIKKVKQFITSKIYCFISALAVLDTFKYESERQNKNYMFSYYHKGEQKTLQSI